jgi:hypothetical protein
METLIVVLVVCLALCLIVYEALRRKGNVRASLNALGLGFSIEASERMAEVRRPRRKRARPRSPRAPSTGPRDAGSAAD